MSLFIATASSLKAQMYLKTTAAINQPMNQLSSGYRIGGAADDAKGLIIASTLTTASTNLQAASFTAALYAGASSNGDASSHEAELNDKISVIIQADQAIASSTDMTAEQAGVARAKLGAELDGLLDASNANSTSSVNLSESLATIRDVDVASATSMLAQQQVMAQAGASVLAQANQAPQLAINMIRGQP